MHEHGNLLEPPLQRRKKPLPLATTETTHWSENGKTRDYVLLGNQNKFAANVRYKPKANGPEMDKGNLKQSEVETTSTPPPAPRLIPPPPKVAVNTGAPTKHHAQIQLKPKSVSVATETHHKQQQNGDHIHRPHNPVKSPAKPSEKQPPPQPKTSPVKSKSATKTDSKPGPPRHNRKGDMNEFVQTDLDKGVADSGQEAPANYALKYKTGVAVPRGRGPKRLSEYQLRYRWQKGDPASPLLAADQVVHQSKTNIGPYKSEAVPKQSEYRRQFHEYKYLPVEEATPAKQAKLKRSKSLEAVNPSKLPAAGTAKVTIDEDQRLLTGSLNPLKLHFPHGKYKKHRSEYNSNFVDPTKVSYEDGAWTGVNPPHMQQPAVAEEVMTPDTDTDPAAPGVGSWFSEVLELRKKASEYKNRARGTHFSRTHVAQLYAQQANLWDTHSTISALSLETGSQRSGRAKEPAAKPAWQDQVISGSESLDSARPVSEVSDASTIRGDDGGGRLATPQIRSSSYVRHHLDRTTPSIGGALLTSPKAKKTPQKGAELEKDSISDVSSATAARQQRLATQKPQVCHRCIQADPGHHRSLSCTCGTQTPGGTTDKATQMDSTRLKSHQLKPSQDGAQRKKPPVAYKSVGSSSDKILRKILDEKMKEENKLGVARSEPAVTQASKMSQYREAVSDTQLVNEGNFHVASRTKSSVTPQGAGIAPTFGMPTQDTHVLLDETASTDRPLYTQYINTPHNHKAVRRAREMFPEVDIPSTIDEDGAVTYKKATASFKLPVHEDQDVDDDSLSVCSLASSCSVASETLERARQRRDEFWSRDGQVR